MQDITAETLELIETKPEARSLFDELRKVPDEKILSEVSKYRLNNEGDIHTLRHRLLRFALKKVDETSTVRWDPERDEIRVTPRTKAKRAAKASYKPRRPTLPRATKNKTKQGTEKTSAPMVGETEGHERFSRRLPSISGVTGLISSGAIVEVPTTSPTITTTTSTLTTTTTATTGSNGLALIGLPRMPSLHMTNTLERFETEWTLRYNALRSPPKISAAESTRLTPRLITMTQEQRSTPPSEEEEERNREAKGSEMPKSIESTQPQVPGLGQRSEKGKGVTQTKRKRTETETERTETATEGTETSPRTTTPEESEEEGQTQKGARERAKSAYNTFTKSQMEELRRLWEAETRVLQKGGKIPVAETIIESHGGGIVETPKGRARGTNNREVVNRKQRVRGFRESTRRKSESEESSDEQRRRRVQSESSEDEDLGFLRIRTRQNRRSRERVQRARGNRDSKAAKHLKTWGIKFAHDGKDDPQEFLDDLAACQRAERLQDEDIMEALYGVFAGEAKLWFRNEQYDLDTLGDFKKAFKRRFMKTATQERLEEDLRGRKQGKDEDIDSFIGCMKRILAEFRNPPRLGKQIRIVMRNLTKEYRRYMIGKELTRIEDIARYGREYEKILEWDEEDSTPRPAEKMVVKSAAYRPKKATGKVAAAQGGQDEVEEEKPQKTKKEKKKEKKKAKSQEAEQMTAAATAEQGVVAQTVNQKQSEKKQNPKGNTELFHQLISCLQGLQIPEPKPNAPGVGTNPQNRRGVSPGTGPAQSATVTPPITCFACGEMGHRVAKCPTKQCYSCQQMGHMANRCPLKTQTTESPKTPRQFTPRCAWCGMSGVQLASCPNCAVAYANLGNGWAGAAGPQNPGQRQ